MLSKDTSVADWKLQLYHKLPSWMRDLAASYRGQQLREWRYGIETEQLVAEALDRDTWSNEKWKAYQDERLGYVLHRAATQVPFYRNQWAERRRQGDKASWNYLENWPILPKSELRKCPEEFVADDCDKAKMYLEQTSGTTGTPLKLWWSRTTTRAWYALFEARIRRWNHVSIREPWAILGGQQVVPPNQKKPPFWVRNHSLNQLYLSANHISVSTVPYFVDAMNKFKITHLIAYPSSATYLAQQMVDHGLILDAPLKVIVTNAEGLSDWQRKLLEQAFACPVRETYGMGEIVATASADSSNRLRLWPEVGIVEVLEDEIAASVTLGDSGRLVCTGLFNADMPLIRYEVGDRGSLSTDFPAEVDPIQLPFMGRIEGRTSDVIITADGRQVFWVNPVFYGLPIVEAQIIQEDFMDFTVKLVPSVDFRETHQASVHERLQRLVGDGVHIQFELMAHIPRGTNKKFRPVISKVPQQNRQP